MSDFVAQIKAKLDISSAESQMQSFLSKYKNETLKIKVDVEGLNGKNFSKQIQNQYTSFGKNVGASFSKGFSVSKFTPDVIDFAKVKQKIQKETNNISKEMRKHIPGITKNETDRWAREYVSQSQRRYDAEAKAAQKANDLKLKNNISALNRESKERESLEKKNANIRLKNANALLQDELSLIDKQAKNKAAIIKAQSSGNSETVNALKQERKLLKQESQKLYQDSKQYKDILPDHSSLLNSKRKESKSVVDKTRASVYDADVKAAQKANQEIAKSQSQAIANIQKRAQSGEFELTNAKTHNFLDKYDGQNSDTLQHARKQFNEIQDLQKELQTGKYSTGNNKGLDIIPEDQITKSNQLDDNLKKLSTTLKTVAVESSKTLDAGIADRSANKVASYMDSNSKAAKRYGVELKSLEQQYRTITTQSQKFELDNQFKTLDSKITADGLKGKSTLAELGKGFKKIGEFAYTYGAIQKAVDAVASSVSEIKNIDTILTEISKTSDLTTSEIKELGNTSFESASKWGKKASDYLTGIQEMSRSGYYGKQAEEMADLSVLAQAAGDMSSQISNSYLLATNAAYKYNGAVNKLNAVLDGQNMINTMVMLYRNI